MLQDDGSCEHAEYNCPKCYYRQGALDALPALDVMRKLLVRARKVLNDNETNGSRDYGDASCCPSCVNYANEPHESDCEWHNLQLDIADALGGGGE